MLSTRKLAGKVIYISGVSRGIGKAIALTVAKDGARAADTDRGYHTLVNHKHPFLINNNNWLNDSAYHNVVFSRKYSDTPPSTFTSVPEVFERINAVANADMVGKVNACYVFELEGGEGKYYIDLKEGDGQAGEGEVPNKASNFKPEVKIIMTKVNMLMMFNKELTPATAFMTGKLILKGDLAKALALQTILKAASDANQ